MGREMSGHSSGQPSCVTAGSLSVSNEDTSHPGELNNSTGRGNSALVSKSNS